MKDQKGERGGSSENNPQQTSHHSSRRRNTVHSSSPEQAQNSSWPPIPAYYPLPPGFLPLYSPLWHLTQGITSNNNGVIPTPFLANVLPVQQRRSTQPSRSASPHKNGQRLSRSPERRSERGHGNNNKQYSGKGGRPPITSRSLASTMPSKKPELSHPLPTRPGLHHNTSQISHQSNSVPSTPHQHARKLSFSSRSPSPNGGLNHSPRSAYSESNSTLPPLRMPPPGCRFEKGMTNSRRRMPYDIGDAKLEKAKGPLKKKLGPEEEKLLTAAMMDLYQRLLPSAESDERRARFVQKLEKLLNDQWPGNDIQVRVFGSSGNKLCTIDSDVDICITTSMKELERVCVLANALAEHGMERVVCVPNAKVPIVKIWDPELELACDMNVNNTLALENTRMIKTYVDIDERVRPLAMIIKYWTKRRILNDAALGGTLSSYTWICMIINFLQTRDPPILPSLHQRPHERRKFIDGVDVSFDDDLESLQGFGSRNTESLGELLFYFFRRYGHEIDFETSVISVRQGKLISKEEKMWHLMQNNRLCVEEPFNIKRNLGNTADDTSVRGLHTELRRAFTLIADEVNLDKCCEQYVWPTESKPLFEKPPPVPRPILSRSSSQSGRGGRGGHGNTRGRHSNNHNHRSSTQSFRRASSGAAIANGNLNFLPQHQLGMSAQEQFMQAQYAQNQLQKQVHDQLYQSYQIIQAQLQENELRYKLLHQAHQAQAQAQARNQGSGQPQGQTSSSMLNGSSTYQRGSLDNPPLTAPIQPGIYFYPMGYPPRPPPQPQQHGTNTNPSSPSITPAIPELRRSLHRTSIGEPSFSGSFRSQSQPASRSLPTALNLQGVAASNYGAGGLLAYEQYRDQRHEPVIDDSGDRASEASAEAQLSGTGSDSPADEQGNEYVGYYQMATPQSAYTLVDHSGQATAPPYADLPHRPRRVSPEQFPTAVLNRIRRNSRSPSPLGPTIAHGSVPQAGIGMPPMTLAQASINGTLPATTDLDSDVPIKERGPLIVNGSTSSSYADSVEFENLFPHGEEDQDLVGSQGDNRSSDWSQDSAIDYTMHPLYAQQLLEKHNQAETVRSETGSANAQYSAAPSYGTVQAQTPPYPGPLTSLLNLPSDEEGSLSPRLSPNLRQRASRRVSLLPITGIPPLDTGRGSIDPGQENSLSTTSPLTPVPEMRTPSPTANRTFMAPLASELHTIKDTWTDAKFKLPPPPPTPANMASRQTQPSPPKVNGHVRGSASVGGGIGNSWQGTKKGKRKSQPKKVSAPEKSHHNLLIDQSERKGG